MIGKILKYCWRIIFHSKITINPFSADKAIIKSPLCNLEDKVEFLGKWQRYGLFYILFEMWNGKKYSRPYFVKGYGGWISIKNLPLDYWSVDIYKKAIGGYFGGLESISLETMNLINCRRPK